VEEGPVRLPEDVKTLAGRFARELSLTAGGAAVTVTGSGGKTSLIRLLAGCGVWPKVLVAPTAKMLMPPPGSYGLFTGSRVLLPAPEGITLAGILDRKTGKLSSPPLPVLEKMAPAYDLLLMEGDGSRGLPLKGWTAREPVVPPFTTVTVGVIPLWPLGRRVSAEIVHRLPLFCALSGAAPGEIIRPGHLANVITAAGGARPARGLFAASRGRRILFFSQIEDPDAAEKARELSMLLCARGFRETVIAGSVFRNTAEW
jgi:probable selenium-dependent hydroxylase accessory protein YqeC